MQDCCNDHQDCAQKETRVPTRVLDIGSKTIKLLSSTGKAGRYCALSHCWGSASHSPPRTTKANLESNQSKIEESSLSKTFRDAIVLARHFSIQYIWIDSLCIIQDDKEDWAKESSNMASIYENAYFVIAATQAEHGGIGCFSPRPPPSVSLCLNVAQANGEFAPIYIREKNDHRPFNPLAAYKARADQRYPLLSRAWCLQERLLATRLIHFSREELFWECRTTTLCECRSLISHEESSYENQIGFKRRWAMNRGLRELFDLWHKTLQLYSSLDITYESDRLPALLGLANQLQERGCGEYIHGLWKENLFADLIWRTSTRGTRPKEWKAPSWSWA
ncbi:HET-domain-containing protein, partial [Mollisia scopiformis]